MIRNITYSVLMSVYGGDSPEYLETALKSIYDDQTKKPDEIVIVEDGPITEELDKCIAGFAEHVAEKKGGTVAGENDDCSCAQTEDSLNEESFTDSGNAENGNSTKHHTVVKRFRLPDNRGLGEALRIGSEQCTGDYIIRMDSDDVSDPRRVELMDRYLTKHPEIDVLGTDIGEFMDDPSKIIRTRVCPRNAKGIARMCRKRNPMNHVSVAIRKEALDEVGGYIALPLLEDYYLWVRMIAAGKVLRNIGKSLVHVRIGNGFEKRRRKVDRVTNWKKIQDFMLEHKMINRFEAFRNMISIRLFVYSPVFIKKFAYNRLLRKRSYQETE